MPALPPSRTTKGMLYNCITYPFLPFNKCFTLSPASAHRLQLVDHARNDRQAAVPEFRVLGVQPERPEQVGIMLGTAGGEHGEITLGKAIGGVLVDRIQRVHQAIAER